MKKTMKRRVIFSLPLCKYLLRQGFRLVDVALSCKDKTKTVFIFENTPALEKAMQDYIQQKQ